MEDLRVPTHSILVQIHTDRGEQLPGALYVFETARDSGPAGQVLVLLNDDRAFVPFRTAYGPGTEVRDIAVNKDHIVRVHLTAWDRPDPERAQTHERGPFRLELADGSTVSGEMLVDSPEASSRPVDKLNLAGRFIPIVNDGGVELIHRRHVLRME